MNINCSVYIAASLDGFIAGPNGEIDWLQRPEYIGSEIKGLRYTDFIKTVDVLVMGRKTFETVLNFGNWPYKDLPVIVLSQKGTVVPEELQGTVRLDSGPPKHIVSRLAAEGNRHLYIDGGATIRRFLEARLINKITITLIPILLGKGIPLFDTLNFEQPLRLLQTAQSENGFVQVRYEV